MWAPMHATPTNDKSTPSTKVSFSCTVGYKPHTRESDVVSEGKRARLIFAFSQ